MLQPLAGLTVVTLEHAIAAPFATRRLEQLDGRMVDKPVIERARRLRERAAR